jgi:N-acetylglucosamine-6-phosphate deacetylase
VNTFAFVNANVLTADGFRSTRHRSGGAGQRARHRGPGAVGGTGEDIETRAICTAMRCSPGFIDAQVNGGGGVLFNNAPTVEALRTIARAHRSFGTTGLLPTLISDDAAVMRAGHRHGARPSREGVPGMLGIHLEGPYLAPARKGTHNAEMFRVPDEADESSWPHRWKTASPCSRWRRNGCRPTASARWCGAARSSWPAIPRPATTQPALDWRPVSAASPICTTRCRRCRGASRAWSVRGAGRSRQLVRHHRRRRACASGQPARGAGGQAARQAVPGHRCDAAGGAPIPDYELYGETITARDGVVRNAAGALAGSALDMATAVRNAVSCSGLPLEEAARMASTYPAEFLGIGDSRGRIAEGYRADLVALDDMRGARAPGSPGRRHRTAA